MRTLNKVLDTLANIVVFSFAAIPIAGVLTAFYTGNPYWCLTLLFLVFFI